MFHSCWSISAGVSGLGCIWKPHHFGALLACFSAVPWGAALICMVHSGSPPCLQSKPAKREGNSTKLGTPAHIQHFVTPGLGQAWTARRGLCTISEKPMCILSFENWIPWVVSVSDLWNSVLQLGYLCRRGLEDTGESRSWRTSVCWGAWKTGDRRQSLRLWRNKECGFLWETLIWLWKDLSSMLSRVPSS